MFVFFKSRIRRTLYDLHCLNFSLKVMLKLRRNVRGHLVTLIIKGMHLIVCLSG